MLQLVGENMIPVGQRWSGWLFFQIRRFRWKVPPLISRVSRVFVFVFAFVCLFACLFLFLK